MASKLKWQEAPFKDPLARAKGLGSARSGVHHAHMQKVTSIAALPLTAWLIWSVVNLAIEGGSFGLVTDWLNEPINAILLILFVISSFYHTALGLQVPIDDYVHSEGLKSFVLLAMKLVLTALAVASVFSILKVAF